MRTGLACGNRRAAQGCPRLGIALFRDDEGGFTTVAVAVALLVSLALTFSVVGAQWTAARAGDVQAVADAAAMAGEDVVATYATVAQVLDACVLSMGLLGLVAMGAGLVACAIPPLAEAGTQAVSWGKGVLDTRRDFARRGAEGLARLEGLLPGLIVANSAAVVAANEGEAVRYGGCAAPYPTESETDFVGLLDDLSGDGLAGLAGELRDAAEVAERAKAQAEGLKERGWLADCGAQGRSLRERAGALAGLSDAANPSYTLENWSFGAPLSRARSYYAARRAAEDPGAYGDPRQIRDSACRKAFYAYALGQVNAGSYAEDGEGRVVSCSLPTLPRNTEQMRATSLYTDPVWPVYAGKLHASVLCPEVHGAEGFASVARLDAGGLSVCETCDMTAFYLGQVASASTNTQVGFEHWWREVVDASMGYQEAKNQQLDAEKRLRDAEDQADRAFGEAMEKLGVRPKLCPPGAWGCVGIVVRSSGSQEVGPRTFASAAKLPAGAAISAATLAPDNATEDNDVIASFFDALVTDDGPSVGGLLDGVGGLWSRLLKGYGSASRRVSDTVNAVLGAQELGPASAFARKLLDTFSSVVNAAGFEAADLRLRKPVLANTAQVLAQAEVDVDDIRGTVQGLPDHAGPADVARAFALHYMDTGDIPESLTVVELPVPGTGTSIPLSLNLRILVGGA